MLKYLLFFSILFTSLVLKAQPLISFKLITGNLSNPVDVVEEPYDSLWLFVVEKTGKIRIVKDSVLRTKPFLDITPLVTTGGEQGLLSMTFHPQYANNGYFYIYYTNGSGNVIVARYTRYREDSADQASGVILMEIPEPYANHNGGKLNFGPDGYLYFGSGDGGSSGDPQNHAQNPTSLLGKMLRIDVNNTNPPYYSIPPTNPFAMATDTTKKKEILSVGLRNPWRYSFDKQTGDMWIGDVGQNLWEEVDIVPYADRINKNFGWRCFEGTHVYDATCGAQPNNVSPIFEYPHVDSIGGYSITGGYIYRGTEYPALQGYYLCADYTNNHGWLIKSNGAGGWTTTLQNTWIDNIVGFGQRANGTLYVTRLTGALYKIMASNILAVKLVSFAGNEAGNKYALNWKIENEQVGDVYVIETRHNTSNLFTEVSKLKVTADKASNIYSLKMDLPVNETFYRLKIITATGQITYSQIVRYSKGTRQYLKAYAIENGVNINPPPNTKMIEVIDETGKKLWSQNASFTSAIQAPVTAKGIFIVRAYVDGSWQVVSVVK